MKKVLRIDKERDTVAYRQRTSYHFRPDLSHGSENDRLVLINVPLVVGWYLNSLECRVRKLSD